MALTKSVRLRTTPKEAFEALVAMRATSLRIREL
jgi:hypothetical protein